MKVRPIDGNRLLKMMSHWKPYMDMDKVRKAVENMPTLTQPNEPLTMKKLREMNGQPVWLAEEKVWALLQVWDDDNIDAVFFNADRVLSRGTYNRHKNLPPPASRTA